MSHWIDLGIGLVLGIGGSWLFRRPTSSVNPLPTVSPGQSDSQLQRLQDQLQHTKLAYHMASEMSWFKAGFLARTSHELRAPLNGLIGAHQLILAGLCDNLEEEREFIAQANESAMKLVTLLDEIITVSKTEQGTEELEIQPIGLTQLLDEVEDLTHLQAQNRNCRLKIIRPESDIYILADPRRLKQVIVHLTDMAISQMKEGGIWISGGMNQPADRGCIWIDVPCCSSIWSESVDLIKQLPAFKGTMNPNPELTPGMNLLINQTLLELMHGHLEIMPASTAFVESFALSNATRIQCSLPRLIPEIID
jgi:K+-sensing histidine kinase KdpD